MELNNQYSELLHLAVSEIRTAKAAIARQVNAAATGVYWNLGKLLNEKKIEKGHGAGVVNRLSVDLKNEFPDMGLSPRNLWNMKRFFERYWLSDPKLQRCVAVLPWRHNLLLLEKVTNDQEAMFYAQKSVELGWSRDILLNYLKADAYYVEKKLPKSHNFKETMPKTVAEQANDMLKNSYNLGFLGLTKLVKETELEQRLIEKIRYFVLELGKGFTFIGNQYRLEYNHKEYFVDILLYHRGIRSLVAIALFFAPIKIILMLKLHYMISINL